MRELESQYHTYKIKKGTTLFRKAANENVTEQMFFGFSPVATFSAYIRTEIIQVWQTIEDIDVLLLLKGITTSGKGISAISNIWNEYFPNIPVQINGNIPEYVFLKQNNRYRNRLVRKLRDKKIYSWICSVENNYEMEFFLFNDIDINSRIVEYCKSFANSSDEYSDIDTFNRSELVNLKRVDNDYDSNFSFLH